MMLGEDRPPLLAQYPALATRLGWLRLTNAPSAVEALPIVSELSSSRVLGFVKRDDRLATRFSGNKLRKLEFSLGEAIRQHCRGVVTFGGAESHHLVPVAHHAAEHGLRATCVLTGAAQTAAGRRHLDQLQATGARVVHCPFTLLSPEGQQLIDSETARLEHEGTPPFVIGFRGGGSFNALGYVNAALELRDQIAAGLLPCPDEVFVPGATLATAAGLAVGFKLAALAIRVCCVRVITSAHFGDDQMFVLTSSALQLLAERGAAMCDEPMSGTEWRVDWDYFDEGNDAPNHAAAESARRVGRSARMDLDTSYSAFAFAALLCAARRATRRGACLLFWNTAPPASECGSVV